MLNNYRFIKYYLFVLLTNQSNSYRYGFENEINNTYVNHETSSQEQNNVSNNLVNNSTDSNTSSNLIDLSELDKTYIPDYDFYFELPINGATGYASINSNIEQAIVQSLRL